MKKKYFFAQFKDSPVVKVGIGYMPDVIIENGYCELDPDNENDKLVIDTHKGRPAPRDAESKAEAEPEPATRKTGKKAGEQ